MEGVMDEDFTDALEGQGAAQTMQEVKEDLLGRYAPQQTLRLPASPALTFVGDNGATYNHGASTTSPHLFVSHVHVVNGEDIATVSLSHVTFRVTGPLSALAGEDFVYPRLYGAGIVESTRLTPLTTLEVYSSANNGVPTLVNLYSGCFHFVRSDESYLTNAHLAPHVHGINCKSPDEIIVSLIVGFDVARGANCKWKVFSAGPAALDDNAALKQHCETLLGTAPVSDDADDADEADSDSEDPDSVHDKWSLFRFVPSCQTMAELVVFGTLLCWLLRPYALLWSAQRA